MDTTMLWIIIALIVIALILIGVVVAGKQRRKSKTVSFDKAVDNAEPKALTQQEKSGNYQAKGGFNFAQAEMQPVQTSPAQPVSRPTPTPPAAPQPAAAAPEPAVSEPVVPEAAADDPVESLPPVDEVVAPDDPGVEKRTAPETPHTAPHHQRPHDAQPTQSAAATSQDSNADDIESADVSELDQAPDQPPTDPQVSEAQLEVEAEDAANAAAVTAAGAQEGRQADAAVSDEAVITEPDAAGDVAAEVEDIAPAAGRIGRLRGRLSRSQNAIGQGLLGILTAGELDEDAWEEIEDTLIMADLGAGLTMQVTENLREKIAERGVSTEAEARAMLRETLIEAGRPEMDRSIKAMPNEGKPAVILVVGVNGTGKTTTTGKLARVLVSMGHSVVLGAADTFRAAAADQLETWGRRVGASTVRGREGADPASVAFDAVATGVNQGADVVLVDTAGRLHTATGLMDQLGKVKRVVEKKTHVDEVLLVLDATVGQNGITQARVFRDVVDITGVVLTKLDGTAKGGIVFQVQEELGVPVKLVGLGEGADDLAPFEVESFVDALLG